MWRRVRSCKKVKVIAIVGVQYNNTSLDLLASAVFDGEIVVMFS